MGLRDFEDWTTEATRSVLTRRREMCEAALLPHLRQESINRTIDELRFGTYELDHGEEIEEIEEMAKRRLGEIRKELAARKKKAAENKAAGGKKK
jgi:hypothetical protein